MFPPGWFSWCLFLALCTSACGLEIINYDGSEVACSQGLSECTLWDALIPDADAGGVDVQNLRPKFKLCCKDSAACALCLVINVELYIHPNNKTESEDHSGNDEEEDYNNPKVSVTICYNAAQTTPMCKKVEFTVNHGALTQSSLEQVFMVIDKPAGVYFSSQLLVYSSNNTLQNVVVPSHEEVCSQERQKHTEDCYVPTLVHVINSDMNQVELHFAGRNTSLHSVCAQYEDKGRCQRLNRMTIPLYSVMPCMCLQAWSEDSLQRTKICPFAGSFEENLWRNVSLSVSKGQMNDGGTMLLWNLSAPCCLKGEVWPCHWPDSLTEKHCTEIKGFRQKLENGTCTQNKGLWEKKGFFEDIDPQLSPCVMVKIEGNGPKLGPICYKNISAAGRWYWSLLVVAVVLPACLTVVLYYFLRNFAKRWVWSWRRKGFVEIGMKGHVVLLSPPDVDNSVSESVCMLGTLLSNQGFSVSVDQWSRKEQCTLGPLPWLHSQLLELNSLGGRVVLILTRKAMERAAEWTHQHKGVDNDLPQILSPYSDVFTASLSLIQADNRLGRAGERFLLVKFDSFAVQPLKRLPEPLQGLPLFQFPSQTQDLLSELTVERKGRGSGGRT